MRKGRKRTKNRDMKKTNMGCTTPTVVAVAILFRLTIISCYFVVGKVCCHMYKQNKACCIRNASEEPGLQLTHRQAVAPVMLAQSKFHSVQHTAR